VGAEPLLTDRLAFHQGAADQENDLAFPIHEEYYSAAPQVVEQRAKVPPSAETSLPEADTVAEQQAAELAEQVEGIGKRITVVTATTDVRVVVGGAVVADFLWNEARPLAPGTPFFLTPDSPFGFDQETFDAHARQTNLFALFTGPEVCGLQSGGMIWANLYNDALIVDRYGLLPIVAFGELKDDYSRYAAGLQLDIFNPLNPTVLPFSYLLSSGNTGAYRGQMRWERYFHTSSDSQITLIGGIGEPIPTTVSNDFELSEDNGWPNLEGRAALGLGPLMGEGLLRRRPFEVGVSGVVGQIRTTQIAVREVADVWGIGGDARWAITRCCGVQGEVYAGQTLGTYGGAVMQNINSVTFEGIESAGWWAEFYYYWVPDCLHSHFGYGMDDPRDEDLAAGQIEQNQTVFANVIWDVNKHLRFAVEFTYRDTDWVAPLLDNEGFGAHYQAMWRF
jgi:hypothetical protein